MRWRPGTWRWSASFFAPRRMRRLSRPCPRCRATRSSEQKPNCSPSTGARLSRRSRILSTGLGSIRRATTSAGQPHTRARQPTWPSFSASTATSSCNRTAPSVSLYPERETRTEVVTLHALVTHLPFSARTALLSLTHHPVVRVHVSAGARRLPRDCQVARCPCGSARKNRRSRARRHG